MPLERGTSSTTFGVAQATATGPLPGQTGQRCLGTSSVTATSSQVAAGTCTWESNSCRTLSPPRELAVTSVTLLGTGKTFHPGDPYQFDYPYSWSFDEFPYGFGGSATRGHPDWANTTSDHIWCDNRTVVCMQGETGCPDSIKVDGGAIWCVIDTERLPTLPDGSKQLLWDQAEVRTRTPEEAFYTLV